MIKKYELLTTDTKLYFGKTLFRIRALVYFDIIKAGELGGYVSDEKCLNNEFEQNITDNSWIDNSSVVNNSRIINNSSVDNSSVDNSSVDNSSVDNSRIINNSSVENSRVENSWIDNSWIYNSSVENSRTINNSWVDDIQKKYGIDSIPEKLTKKFDFSETLKYLKQGKKMARIGWNGKGMFLVINNGYSIDIDNVKDIGHINFLFLKNRGLNKLEILPHIDMWTAQNTLCVGWIPSQIDLFAEDWYIVE